MKMTIVAGAADLDLDDLLVSVKNSKFVIAADSGLRHLDKISITPDVLIGDLDSVDSNRVQQLKEKINVQEFPRDKDHSDLELAFFFAEKSGATQIDVHAWCDSRIDYAWAAALGLRNAKAHVDFYGPSFIAHLLNANRAHFQLKTANKQKASVLGLSKSLSLKSQGFKWELHWEGAREPRISLSNEIHDGLNVHLTEGSALLMLEKPIKS